MGEKGRITTTHCQPRALSKEPFDTLSKKLNKIGEELANFVSEIIQDANKDTADGILIGLISNSGMTTKEASTLFKIGTGRWSRLYKKQPARKGHGFNGQQILPDNLQHLSDFLNTFEVELGYPCRHRKMKRYSSAYDTYKSLWEGYVNLNPTGIVSRKMKYTTFHKYLENGHPDLALQRAKEDECDTCMKFKMIINNDRTTAEERVEAQACLVKHNQDSMEMRVAMQTAVVEFGRKIIPSQSDIGVIENLRTRSEGCQNASMMSSLWTIS